MKMKKYVCRMLSLALLACMVTLTGCGEDNKSAGSSAPAASQTSSVSSQEPVVSGGQVSQDIKKGVAVKNEQFFALPYDGIASITSDGRVALTYVDNIDWEKVDDAKSWSNIKSLSSGYKNLFGLRSDGTVAAAGNNENGQCNVSGWTDVVMLDACLDHTAALKSDGTAYAAGKNTVNQCAVSDWKNLIDISVGYENTVGLQQDGTVVVTGGNQWGQSDLNGWKNIKMVSAGYYHTVGLQKDGRVAATGSNKFGQCDVGEWTDVVAVYAGKMHTVALKSDGTVVAAGNNDYGQCDVSSWRNVKELFVEKNYTVGRTASGEFLITGLCFYDSDISDRKYYLKDYQKQVTGTTDVPAVSSVSEISSKPEAPSQPEISSKPEVPSEPEQPSQQSTLSESEKERNALQEYAASMQKEGEIVYQYSDGYTKTWKVNNYKIDDFNLDGSPELVIQYYCGIHSQGSGGYAVDNPKQGIALKIVKYTDGQIREYQNYDDFGKYIRVAGADIGRHSEVTEELYVDGDGNLGIFSSRSVQSSATGLLFELTTIQNNQLQQADGFGVFKIDQHGRYGFNNQQLISQHYWWLVSADNTYDVLYQFYRIKNIFNVGEEFMELKEFSQKFNSLDSLNIVSDFAVTSESSPLSDRNSMKEIFKYPESFYAPY